MGTPAQEIYGPILLGVVFNVLLYGIMITQTYMYFQQYKNDRLWMKCFVLFLFFADTVNSALDIAFTYMPLINRFGDVESLLVSDWVFATDPFMTAFIGFLVQLFFVWRVKVLTGNMWMVMIILFCAVAQCLGGLGTSIAVGMIPRFVEFQKFKIIVIIWLTMASIADTLITVSLVLHLRKNKTGMAFTDDIINRIIRITVQTGLITAVWATVDLIVYLVSTSGWHIMFNIPLSKLYTNSLMSTLNARNAMQSDSSRGQRSAASGTESRRPRNVAMLRSDAGRHGMAQQIYIDVESHEMVDVADVKPGMTYPGISPVTYHQEKVGADRQTQGSDHSGMDSAAVAQ